MANVPLIATFADQTATQAAGAASQLVPPGAIMSYGGANAPTGWLLCDGAAVSRTVYANLFSAIGTSFGAGDGSTTFNLPDMRGRFVRYDDNMGNHGITGVTGSGAASRDTGRTHGSAQAQTTAKNGLTNTSSTVSGTTNVGHSHGGTGVGGSVGGDGAHNHRVFIYDTGSNDVLSVGTTGGNNGWSVNTGLNANQGNFRMVAGNDGTFSSNHGHGFSLTAGGQSLGTSNISLASGSAVAQTITGDTETRPINIALNAIIKI